MEDNFGDEVTRIYWVGLKGDYMKLGREPVEVLYEKAANPRDHKLVGGVREGGMLGEGGGREGM